MFVGTELMAVGLGRTEMSINSIPPPYTHSVPRNYLKKFNFEWISKPIYHILKYDNFYLF